MNFLDVYGNKIRIRVCGICTNLESILLINHQGITTGDFWAPPGGGLEFEETAEKCLVREFKEETGIDITVGKFLFVCEFIAEPLHAIELFFEVTTFTGNLLLGSDPELGNSQVIKSLKFMNWEEEKTLSPIRLHGVFNHLEHPSQIKKLSGYFKV